MQVLLSIKPEYISKIFSGEKKFEFRKSLFSNDSVNEIFIYATSPVKKILGKFTIGSVYTDTPNTIWKITSKAAGISRKEFFEYFKGKERAYAIEVVNPLVFKKPIDPQEYIENFVPPQSFRYLDEKIIPKYRLRSK